MAKGTLRFLGHAFFELTTADGKVILFDPWTKDAGNPVCPLTTDEITKADLILASHDHHDHIGSALPIAQKTGALVGAVVQTAGKLQEQGLSSDQVVNFGMGFHYGGGVDLDWVSVRVTPAWHHSETGSPAGYIIKTADGTSLYHAGDTGLFGDMALYGKLYPIDVALLPIGGVFTMDAFQAAEAVNLLNPKQVVPMHYGSFPVVAPTADQFQAEVAAKAPGVKVTPIAPGESISLG